MTPSPSSPYSTGGDKAPLPSHPCRGGVGGKEGVGGTLPFPSIARGHKETRHIQGTSLGPGCPRATKSCTLNSGKSSTANRGGWGFEEHNLYVPPHLPNDKVTVAVPPIGDASYKAITAQRSASSSACSNNSHCTTLACAADCASKQ